MEEEVLNCCLQFQLSPSIHRTRQIRNLADKEPLDMLRGALEILLV
jgi:hypothetical protein